EFFCLSYNIRKENNFYLYFLAEDFSVKFIGNELRYLGPDERSQALLLNKAIKKGEQYTNSYNQHWIESTPGIYIKKFLSFDIFIEELSALLRKNFQVVINRKDIFKDQLKLDIKEFKDEKLIEDKPIIILLNENLPASILSNIMVNINDLRVFHLSKIKSPENKILYINFSIENFQN
ncbi:MAG: hypothetical protein EU548_02800, partial [Promethearchaeota archaeon]